MKKTIVLLGLILSSLSLAVQPVTAATTISNLNANSTQVGQYEKLELTFQISRTFPADSFQPYYYYDASDTPSAYPGRNSPYGVDGITIDATFTSPSGKQLKVPAFYYQDYTRTRSGDTEVMTPGNSYSWKVRFAPEEVGTYQYYLTVSDKDGTSRFPASGTQSFTAVQSGKPGFIRTSPRDSRFLEYSNGQSYVPIGSGHQWWECCGKRSYDIEDAYNSFGANGINLTRLWTQNDGYNLTVEGHFDGYTWPDDTNPEDRGIDINSIPKGTQINQRGAYQLDKILEAAERNKIGVVVSAHADPYWIWDVDREEYSNNVPYDNYWKRNYRYRIARWGYSTSVLTWERWNEHGHISMGTAIANWYINFHNWVRQNDPYKHLVTTSQGSQAYSPAFYSSAAADYTSYHDYLMSSRYNADLEGDTTNFIYRAAQCLRVPGRSGCFFGDGSTWNGSQKPIFFGEFDSGTTEWNVANPHPLVQHNGMWAGLFSEAGSGPIDWYFDAQDYLAQKYADAKVASNFFADIDYAGAGFSYLSTSDISITSAVISATHDKIRVLAMRASNPNHAYAWVQHKDHRWKGNANPSPVSGSFTLSGMTNGTYNLEYWNTTTGAKTTATATAANGNLSVPVNNLSADTAIKIRHTSYTGSGQITPVPTATSTQNSCPTDINQDSITDISDYAILVTYFLQENPAVPRADINQDNIVDISDYSLLVTAFLQECQ